MGLALNYRYRTTLIAMAGLACASAAAQTSSPPTSATPPPRPAQIKRNTDRASRQLEGDRPAAPTRTDQKDSRNRPQQIAWFEAGITLAEPGPDGARILGVIIDSPAARAGLQPRDILLEVGKQQVDSLADLEKLMHSSQPGATLKLVVRRGIVVQRFELVLPRPTETSAANSFVPFVRRYHAYSSPTAAYPVSGYGYVPSVREDSYHGPVYELVPYGPVPPVQINMGIGIGVMYGQRGRFRPGNPGADVFFPPRGRLQTARPAGD